MSLKLKNKNTLFVVAFLVFIFNFPLNGYSQSLLPNIAAEQLSLADENSTGVGLSAPFQILLTLTLLSVAPALLMLMTAFTRIVIVLSMLRQALAMPSTPPNSVLISFAFLLTIFVMTPVFEKVNEDAIQPYLNKDLSFEAALVGAQPPLKEFMVEQTREKDISLVYEMSGKSVPESIDEVGLFTLVPAFLISELQSAFLIGFMIFLPFLMIDLIVASVLMSMGMIMLPPTTVSLPIKVLVFVLIDGWSLLAYSLLGSFS
ncbi:flagellar type III secretion system pore protein FliP [Microbulbifer sp. SSSA005]|uniref:flagellar type III secretion system pore protein FliP n=1 Tax=unclassified Microbulbifer TaxID=2619833 RepID=UPI00403B2303